MNTEELDLQFTLSLKWANDMLYTGFHSDEDFKRSEKIIGHCATYFSSRNIGTKQPISEECPTVSYS